MRLIVIDAGAFDYPLHAPWRVPAVFGSGSQAVRRMFETLGVKYIDASRIRPPANSLNSDERQKMELAVKSTVIIWFGRVSGPGSRPGPLDNFIHMFDCVPIPTRFCTKARVHGEIFAGEGLHRKRKICRLARKFSCSPKGRLGVVFPEIQSDRRRLCLRNYRVHDRVAMQKDALEITAEMPKNLVSAHSVQWIAEWRPQNSKLNPFSSLWKASKAHVRLLLFLQ